MLSNAQKYFLAAAVSLSGVGMSVLWYRHATAEFLLGDGDGEKLAVLQSGRGEVERKPGERLIWQQLTDGAALVNGDTLRTGARGEGKVTLLESGTVISVEPDSLIVIEKSKGAISLDLLSGGLFVKSESKTSLAAAAPTIKAGNTRLSLGSASTELTLSMDKGKTATVAVAKGNIDLDTNGKQVTLNQGAAGAISDKGIKEQKVMQVLAPGPNAVVDIGPTGDIPVSFTWPPLNEKLQVYLEIGESRTVLKRAESPGVPARAGILALKLPALNFYWRLVAVDPSSGKADQTSLVFRASTIALSPPVLVSPRPGEPMFLSEKKVVEVLASWSNPQFAEKTILVVAKGRDFKDIVYRQNFEGGSEGSFEIRQAGTYHWRVLAFFAGREKPLSSEVSEFIINDKLELNPPVITFPENGSVIPLAKLKDSSLFLRWNEVPGIENYQIAIKSKDGKFDDISDVVPVAQFRMTSLSAGTYTWRLKSVGPGKQASAWSKPATFSVSSVGSLAWLEPVDPEYRYKSKRPSVVLAWEPGPQEVKKWQLRFAKSVEELDAAEWQTMTMAKTKLSLASDGKYFFEVRGLDKDETVLAVGKMRSIDILPPPPLEAPEFIDFASDIKRAAPDGSIKLKWNEIKEASGYVIVLDHSSSKEKKKYEEESTSLKLTGLGPGKYKVQISAVNERGEQGKSGEARYIEVPNVSNIAPPKVNSIKVH